jgi:hypothetical protein
MTRAQMGLLAVLALVSALVALTSWRRSVREREEVQRLKKLIQRPIYREEFRKADERLPARAAEWRTRAEELRRKAAQLESGQPETCILRVVGWPVMKE